MLTNLYIRSKIRVMKAIEERELGQGTLEYVGIVIVAAILVAAIVGALDDGNLIKEEIGRQIKKITSQGD